jgi:hypothetical protein
MPEFDNELTGALFTNHKKETDNQPDYAGNCTIEGVDYWISGWIKKPKAGGKNFLSLSFKVKENIVAKASAPARMTVTDDDIPF